MKSRRNPHPERATTDRSLKAERRTTDTELGTRRATAQADADAILARARARANTVLAHAREREDTKMRAEGADVSVRAETASERARSDAILSDERARETRTLATERAVRGRALGARLGRERASTDRHLSFERGRSDMLASRHDFLSLVSHDMGTLVAAVALSSASLLNVSRNASVVRTIAEHVKLVTEATAALKRLADDLTDIAAMEAGSFAIAVSPQDASGLARVAAALFEAEATAKGITLSTHLPSGPTVVRCDRDRILQVLANLVRNAIRATPAAGVVEIGVSVRSQVVHFTVSDTGAGFGRRRMSHAFERGWRGPDEVGPGLGLGLYIARGIVEAHGGTIRLTRRRAGGTTVDFTVPPRA